MRIGTLQTLRADIDYGTAEAIRPTEDRSQAWIYTGNSYATKKGATEGGE